MTRGGSRQSAKRPGEPGHGRGWQSCGRGRPGDRRCPGEARMLTPGGPRRAKAAEEPGALAAAADGFVSPRVGESPQHCSLRGLQQVVLTGVADGRGTVGTE